MESIRNPRPPGDGTNYFLPFSMLTFSPNFTFEADFYVIAGDYGSARQTVYGLRQELGPASNIFAALGSTDVPSPGSTLSGPVDVGGWAFANANLASVEILVDKMADGTASYGSARPGVADTFFHAPANIGFSYSLDTTRYANGPHTLNVRVTDVTGNVSVFSDVAVTFSNPAPVPALFPPQMKENGSWQPHQGHSRSRN